MKCSLKRQQGLSFISSALALVVMGIFVLIAIQIVPLYYDYTTVRSVLDEVAEDAGSARMGRGEVWSEVSKKLSVNNIGYLRQDDLQISQNRNGGTVLTLKYEERRHLVGNVFLVVSFDHISGE